MRAVIQRVTAARVEVAGETIGEIGQGLLILLGVHTDDEVTDINYLVDKIANLRIFADENGKMNLSLLDIGGSALVVSQFTLYADTRRGRRPGFSSAAPPQKAESLYEQFCTALQTLKIPVATGRFGADMDVHLINQGPVTIIIDTET
ncbi:MAG: D-tyrosyl-tRNA(Tyr) deacylase [Firmicutes bacterium]|jgi:D-tyrosyl-tRNA(Tyr) deacylase|nr:D-tyrosyl-tRNA(Tyr) deacylase [Bacillota bacterium]